MFGLMTNMEIEFFYGAPTFLVVHKKFSLSISSEPNVPCHSYEKVTQTSFDV
jgi:hypothetical protein